MESLKKKFRNLPLRRFFILSVLFTICMVVILSGLTIWGCLSFRHYLLPDANSVYLTVEQTFADGRVTTITSLAKFGEDLQNIPQLTLEDGIDNEILDSKYSIEKIENSFDTLTPKRKIAYQGCGVIMVAVPAILSIAGILVCGFHFYRRKLSEPLRILSNATEQIAKQNLDFSLDYSCQDEMGQLYNSFDQMREALLKNNKAMWKLLEQRRLMQASIAHDLRNPIAIIEGYTEYLQLNLPNGNLSAERIERIVNNLNMAAKRLEHYTESVRTLNQLEDMEIKREYVSFAKLIEDISNDFKIMADNARISLNIISSLSQCELHVDNAILYRILENIFGNALRFAKSVVSISFYYESSEHNMYITVTDDGAGFSDEVLTRKESLLLPTRREDGHLGVGLAMSRALSEKHGGSLTFFNNDTHNAVVEIILAV